MSCGTRGQREEVKREAATTDYSLPLLSCCHNVPMQLSTQSAVLLRHLHVSAVCKAKNTMEAA